MKMLTATFVIGATATGKSHFIKEIFPDIGHDMFDIYDYQQQAYKEAGYENSVPFHEQFKCLYRANEMLLDDVIKSLQQGRSIVVEHTLYKAKRRIAYIDAIRKAVDIDEIEFFVMSPNDARWEANLAERKLREGLPHYKKLAAQIEFPSPAEGIDRIYEVLDEDEIRKCVMQPNSEIVALAHQELAAEAGKMRAEEEKRRKRRELLESMNERPFWHYCEVCGKKEFINAQEAFDTGWDYPPKMGCFGLLGPRKCGNCGIADTLFWKVHQQSLPIVIESSLTEDELVTWQRIKGEPESLLVEA